MAEATVYLQLEPTWSWYNPDQLTGMNVVTMTKTRPKHPRGPVVQLKLLVPDAAFKPLRVVVDTA